MEKICSKCKTTKNVSEFYKNKKTEGFCSSCKKCCANYTKELYTNIEVIIKNEKYCCKCKKVKDIEEFPKYFNSLDKKFSYCRECCKIYNDNRITKTLCECGKVIKYMDNRHLKTKYHKNYISSKN